MFAKIKNNTVVEWPITNIRILFPNISFPEVLTDSAMPENYVMVNASVPPSVASNQKVVGGKPIKQGTKWVQGWDIVSISQSEIDEQKFALENSVRANRDQKLQSSDWVVVKAYETGTNVPVEWSTYREALRNISKQPGFPYEVNWPIAPI